MKKIIFFLLILILFLSFTTAHETYQEVQGASKTFQFTNPSIYLIASFAWLILFSLMIAFREIPEKNKKLYFILMIFPIILATIFLVFSTIYNTINSETKGPVHWHADYKVIACGQELDLVKPQGLSNKIGTPLIHEHNDNRIHIEGTLKDIEEASLKNYFHLIGGELEQGHLIYPTNAEKVNLENGDFCNQESTLKVYVNGIKLENFEDYILYPDSYVPPGDCIIVLFDESTSETTDIICDSWQVKGWTYDNYKRREITISDHTWF